MSHQGHKLLALRRAQAELGRSQMRKETAARVTAGPDPVSGATRPALSSRKLSADALGNPPWRSVPKPASPSHRPTFSCSAGGSRSLTGPSGLSDTLVPPRAKSSSSQGQWVSQPPRPKAPLLSDPCPQAGLMGTEKSEVAHTWLPISWGSPLGTTAP